MVQTCDGEKNYLLFHKNEYSEEEAIKEAKKILPGNLKIEYADSRGYGQYTVCKEQGEYYCISEEKKGE